MKYKDRLKDIDYIKAIFWVVTLIVITIVVIGVSKFNAEMDKYEALYKGVTPYSEVEKEYSKKVDEWINNTTYNYEDEIIDISNFSSVGDFGNGKGIRYFDDEGLYLKDNDIVNIIPKSYFFTFIPNGKIVLGKGYGFYIRTIKDLYEEIPGYYSKNYFKSIVVLFTCPYNITKNDNKLIISSTFNIVGKYEFHSYKNVSKDIRENIPSEYLQDIIDNGVVNYYRDIDSTDNIIFEAVETRAYLEYESKSLGYKLIDNLGNEIEDQKGYGTTVYVTCIDIKDDDIKDVRIVFAYKLKIQDALWMDITWLPELPFDDELKVDQIIRKPI